MILYQPVRQAPGEPGIQNKIVPLARPAKALDCTVEVPISSYDSWRNNSPNPSISASRSGFIATKVLSRAVNPYPQSSTQLEPQAQL